MVSCQTLINIILQTEENKGGGRIPLHTIGPRLIPMDVSSASELRKTSKNVQFRILFRTNA